MSGMSEKMCNFAAMNALGGRGADVCLRRPGQQVRFLPRAQGYIYRFARFENQFHTTIFGCCGDMFPGVGRRGFGGSLRDAG